jgi:hypothetical protein
MKLSHKILAAAMLSTSVMAAPALSQVVIQEGPVETLPAPAPAPVEVVPSQETTGSIVVPVERVTEVRQVFVEAAPEPVAVDFEVATGVVVPETVVLQPVPAQVVEIVPEYEGYQYVAVDGGGYAIVEPSSSEIVYVID